jgi:hypothetical protein
MPTHLNVEDTLLSPLTLSLLARLAAGLSPAYITWDRRPASQRTRRPAAFSRLAGLLIIVLSGGGERLLRRRPGLVACCQPAGVGLHAWALTAVTFALGSRRMARATPV